MMVVGSFRDDLLKEFIQVPDEAGFEFDSRDSRRRARNKDCGLSFLQTRICQRLLKRRRHILDVAVTSGLHLDFFCMNSQLSPRTLRTCVDAGPRGVLQVL